MDKSELSSLLKINGKFELILASPDRPRNRTAAADSDELVRHQNGRESGGTEATSGRVSETERRPEIQQTHK